MLLAKLSGEPQLSLSVIALGEGRLVEELRAAGVDVKVIPNPHRRFSFCFRESHSFLRHKQIDVLHSHKSKEHILAWILAKTMGVPHIIQTQHGMPEPKSLKDDVVYSLARKTAKSASRIISVSADLGRQLQRYIEPNKIAIVPNAIDIQGVRSRLSREAAKRSLGVAEHVPLIGTAARLEPVKRIDVFLAVAQHLSAKCACAGLPDPFFVVAGEGSERSRLQQLIEGTALRNRVVFLGHRNDVYDIIRAMDLLLITSDHEGMPTLVLEAMALGTAVVSRKVGGVPEIIDDGVEGVLVDKSDPVSIASTCLKVLTSPELVHRLTEAARQKVVSKFSAEANASQVLEIYRSLLRLSRAEAGEVLADAA